MSEAPNCGIVEGYFIGSNLKENTKITKVKNCRKSCVSCPYLQKELLCQFKKINKLFCWKNSELLKQSFNLCCHFPKMKRGICKRNGLSRKYLRETYKSCNINNWQITNIYILLEVTSFIYFLLQRFFKKKKILKKNYGDYFTDKFKNLLNKKISVKEMSKVADLDLIFKC